jgi:putative N6-adenine-specific DNA methylase
VLPNQLEAFAVTALGLEPITGRELTALGIRGKPSEGGVAWRGDWESVARANLWLRTASRVLVRVAEFRATAFFELELQAKRIPWRRFVPEGASVAFRVTCRKSKLYHSDAVAERLAKALIKAIPSARIALGVGSESGPGVDPDDDDSAADASSSGAPPVLFVVRFYRDVATVSVDSSGAPLHRRGYRQQLAKAPLRETLAAAMLLAAGWDGTTPLLDPMCGSGTIPIEAARLARRIAPGRDRDFAFVNWPEIDRARWRAMLDDARRGELAAPSVSISGSDRDAGAIAAARANAERAGVAADVEFAERAISAMPPEATPGLVIANPPYGVRVGNPAALRDLYAQLGNVLRANRPQAHLALLSADQQLERQLRIPLEERFATRNGGIPVRCVIGPVSPAD